MKTIAFAALLALVALFAAAPSARAQIYYPWCAVYSGGMGGGGTNCGFSTIEQCRATVSGVGGFCQQNPFYTGTMKRPARRHRHSQR